MESDERAKTGKASGIQKAVRAQARRDTGRIKLKAMVRQEEVGPFRIKAKRENTAATSIALRFGIEPRKKAPGSFGSFLFVFSRCFRALNRLLAYRYLP